MHALLGDVRYSARSAWKRPALTASILLTLALGIGANTAVFSVVDGVLLRPLPYASPDQLVVIRTGLPEQDVIAPRNAGPEIVDLRERAATLAQLGGIWARPAALTDDASEPEEVEMGFVTAGFLSVFGVEPLLGRDILPAEDVEGAPPVVVLSHGLWTRRYGADLRIVGRTISMDGEPHTVVGVLPPGFTLLLPPDAGVPVSLQAFVAWAGQYEEMSRAFRVFTIVARLERGATVERADAELAAIASSLVADHPADYETSGLELHAEPLHEGVTGTVRPALVVLWATVGFVLLIACFNVANLLLVRATTLEREVLIRSALGASRARLLRQLVTETLLLSFLGGLLGILLAGWGVDLLAWLRPADLPRLASIAVDGRALAFTLLASVTSGTAIGLLSAFHLTRPQDGVPLRARAGVEGGRHRLRRLLVVAEIALSLALLVGAALLMGSFRALAGVALGYSVEGVTTLKLSLIDYAYPYSEPEKIAEFYRRLHADIARLRDVESAGSSTQIPLDGVAPALGPYSYERPDGEIVAWESVAAAYQTVTPGFLETLRVPLLEGRLFSWRDDLEHPTVAVVDERLARTAWPGESAVGKRIRIVVLRRGFRTDWAQVVGVVGEVRHRPGHDVPGQIFVPHPQSPQRTMTVAVRSALPPAALGSSVKEIVEQMEPTQPIHSIRPMSDYRAVALAEHRFTMLALGAFAALAVVLAAFGIYAVLAFTVSRQTQELGVRMALGASPSTLARAVLGQCIRLVAPGLAIGICVAIGFSRVLRGLLFQVSPTDAATIAAVAGTLGAVALAACWLPARRAAKLDPSTALREE